MRALAVLAILAIALTAGCLGVGREPEVVVMTATPVATAAPVPTATPDIQATVQASLQPAHSLAGVEGLTLVQPSISCSEALSRLVNRGDDGDHAHLSSCISSLCQSEPACKCPCETGSVRYAPAHLSRAVPRVCRFFRDWEPAFHRLCSAAFISKM